MPGEPLLPPPLALGVLRRAVLLPQPAGPQGRDAWKWKPMQPDALKP